ncbi:MFS transporter [Pedobacter faecalis]|uniref:MFS transporter n=1 Tax=Pedobacter faecalis TaxID=3041495 RepID=UPI00254BABF4|nr:MFS transporter [Pedobacter sp. ELA7]
MDMNNTTKIPNLGLITAVASLGGLLFGFDMAVVSGVLPLVQKQFVLNSVQEGWFVSSALLGCIIGVAGSGELADRFGRRALLLLSAVLFLVSAAGCAFMPSLSTVIACRLLGGIGIGIASNVVPLYISEIAPANIRGRLVTYYQLALTFGILLAYLTNAGLLNYALADDASQGGTFAWLFIDEVWRGMFGVALIPALLFLVGLLYVPESPRWLQSRHTSSEPQGSYKELLAPGMRKALLIGIFLPLFSQFSGINAIIYYGPSILSDAGLSLSNSLMSQIILGLANMLFTLVAIWKVDSWGRRPLYIFGTIGATVALFLTGLCFYMGATTSLVLLICVLAFLACFAFSIGPLKFVVASEIFPGKIRGRAMAISIMVMWVADTIVGQLTPMLLRNVGTANTFWFFAFFCLIAFIVVYRMLPETKGQSLEQIEEKFVGH